MKLQNVMLALISCMSLLQAPPKGTNGRSGGLSKHTREEAARETRRWAQIVSSSPESVRAMQTTSDRIKIEHEARRKFLAAGGPEVLGERAYGGFVRAVAAARTEAARRRAIAQTHSSPLPAHPA